MSQLRINTKTQSAFIFYWVDILNVFFNNKYRNLHTHFFFILKITQVQQIKLTLQNILVLQMISYF